MFRVKGNSRKERGKKLAIHGIVNCTGGMKTSVLRKHAEVAENVKEAKRLIYFQAIYHGFVTTIIIKLRKEEHANNKKKFTRQEEYKLTIQPYNTEEEISSIILAIFITLIPDFSDFFQTKKSIARRSIALKQTQIECDGSHVLRSRRTRANND